LLAILPQISYANNMDRRGFTIIELIVVIAVMGILLVLAVANIQSSQVNARDDERKSDINTIATRLDSYYSTANLGAYPPTTFTTTEASITNILTGIDPLSLQAPGVTGSTISLIAANTNATQSPSASQYIYQPLDSSGNLCTTAAVECRTFVLYGRLETGNAIYKVMSKNQ